MEPDSTNNRRVNLRLQSSSRLIQGMLYISIHAPFVPPVFGSGLLGLVPGSPGFRVGLGALPGKVFLFDLKYGARKCGDALRIENSVCMMLLEGVKPQVTQDRVIIL